MEESAFYHRVSQCETLRLAVSLTWKLVKMQILGFHPDLLNQNLWVAKGNLGFSSSSGDADQH